MKGLLALLALIVPRIAFLWMLALGNLEELLSVSGNEMPFLVFPVTTIILSISTDVNPKDVVTISTLMLILSSIAIDWILLWLARRGLLE